MDKEISKILYDHKDVCESFRDRGIECALQNVMKKRDLMMNILTENMRESKQSLYDKKANDERILLEKKYLQELARGLYYFVIYVIKPEDTEILYKPNRVNLGDMSKGGFEENAGQILENYKKYIHPRESDNKHIEEACRYIRTHLEEELTLENVASQIYIGRCHLCWLFRNCKNINFSDYVTNERLKLAKDLLKDDSFSMDYVSSKCGFSSSSYFSTVFKKNEGMSPREYRKTKLKAV